MSENQEYRIELAAGLIVYIPVRPTVHATAKDYAVMSA